MVKMKGIITPQSIISRIARGDHNSSTGIRLGEFKDVVMNMLETNSNDLFIHETISKMVKQDLFKLNKQKNAKMVILIVDTYLLNIHIREERKVV